MDFSKFKFFASIQKRWAENERKAKIEEVNKSVQVREFEGKLYLCYKDVPLAEESMLNMSICTTVKEVRDNVQRYYNL